MDFYCPRQSPYQPSAGRVYLDSLPMNGREVQALESSLRPLPRSELEEYNKQRDANSRLAKLDQAHFLENRAFTALHQCKFPAANGDNERGYNHRKPSGGNLQDYLQPDSKSRPVNLANENDGQQQSLGTRRKQRGHLGPEVAEQEKSVARLGLGGLKLHGEGMIPQKTFLLGVPDYLFPRNCAPDEKRARHMQEHSRASEQHSKSVACGQWVRDSTTHVSSNARASQESGQRKLTQQMREQQKARLPITKPGNLDPGTSRISKPPAHVVQHDEMYSEILANLALGMALKSTMDGREVYRKYMESKMREMEEKQRKYIEEEERKMDERMRQATTLVPTSEATKTESVKQLLAGVNKVLEQKVEAAKVEAVEIKSGQNEGLRPQYRQQYKGPLYAYKAALKSGERFWQEYLKDYSRSRLSDDHRKGEGEPAPQARILPREATLDSFRPGDFRAASEAIDKASGDLLPSPTTACDEDNLINLEYPPVSASQGRERCIVPLFAGVRLVISKDIWVKLSGQDVSPLHVPQAGQTDNSSELKKNEVIIDNAVEAGPLGDFDIQSEWEEVENSFGDDGWSEVEQDLMANLRSGTSSPLDVGWASDVASETADEGY